MGNFPSEMLFKGGCFPGCNFVTNHSHLNCPVPALPFNQQCDHTAQSQHYPSTSSLNCPVPTLPFNQPYKLPIPAHFNQLFKFLIPGNLSTICSNSPSDNNLSTTCSNSPIPARPFDHLFKLPHPSNIFQPSVQTPHPRNTQNCPSTTELAV